MHLRQLQRGRQRGCDNRRRLGERWHGRLERGRERRQEGRDHGGRLPKGHGGVHHAKGGLMYQAAVAGQKISYTAK